MTDCVLLSNELTLAKLLLYCFFIMHVFCNNGIKCTRSTDDLFCSSAYLLYFMRFSHPIAFWLCAEVSYLARFPHSTACLIGCASLIF